MLARGLDNVSFLQLSHNIDLSRYYSQLVWLDWLMAVQDDERTPLLRSSNAEVESHLESSNGDAADTKNPDNPANLSPSRTATILAANWVCYKALVDTDHTASGLTACYASPVVSII